MSWTFELGHGATRGYVTPMDGGTYRLTITRPGGAGSLFIGLPTVAKAVESFCTLVASDGEHVPIEARAHWDAFASGIDGGGAPAVLQ